MKKSITFVLVLFLVFGGCRIVLAQADGKEDLRRGFTAEFGYGGGSGIAGVGYRMPIREKFILKTEAGYGIGNNYSVVTANMTAVIPLGDNFAGAGISMSNYSRTVTNILGISGNIDQGTRWGAGIYYGRNFGRISARLGYDLAQGLTAGMTYKF